MFGEVRSALDGIDPPSEIADDWDTLIEGIDAVIEVFEGVDFEDPEALLALQDEFAEVEESFGDVEGASERIEEYVSEECGIELGED